MDETLNSLQSKNIFWRCYFVLQASHPVVRGHGKYVCEVFFKTPADDQYYNETVLSKSTKKGLEMRFEHLAMPGLYPAAVNRTRWCMKLWRLVDGIF